MIRKLASAALRKIGWGRIKPGELESCLGALATSGFNPKYIMDVGANLGNWTRTALRFFPQARYELIEPQVNLGPALQDLRRRPNVRIHHFGAGKVEGNFKLTLTPYHDSCTFKYSEAEAAKLGLRQIVVPVRPLDKFVAAEHLPVPDLCKIDAEGWDLDVLDGAKTFFGVTEIFFVEACMMPNVQANSLAVLVDKMAGLGYTLFDFTDLNRGQSHGALLLVEAAFIRKGGLVSKAIAGY